MIADEINLRGGTDTKMDTFRQFLNGKNITLEVQHSDFMDNVKTKIQDKEGISLDHQWLGFTDSRQRMDKSRPKAKARKIPTLNLLHLCGSIIESSLCQSLQKDKYDKAMLCCPQVMPTPAPLCGQLP
ncbi:ubiquitin-60S ribosomal protein L40-like protein [Cricetulus griseus]|uniref:Ubiquitin-60S ribosomal protein L40-like protein n=1 Tax=Cricetulus griseus TaxID=10029 RepID=A0A061HTZ3_CRIGR|nr:ubiquitin-60S ribosomal protein L40-like protein [Cricetulus griseus]